jgi:cytoskeletal protein CcmA (bactofilin family)
MWRKQDQPKSSSAYTETPVPSAVESSVAAAGSVPVPVSGSKPTQESRPASVGSYLTATLRIKGEITGREDVLIEANVEGRIGIEGATVTVGQNGRIAANIEASDIAVNGYVRGNLQAAGRVRVGATGQTQGAIVASRLIIEDGAEIHSGVETIRTDGTAEARPATATENIAVPQAVPGAPSLSKESSAAA